MSSYTILYYVYIYRPRATRPSFCRKRRFLIEFGCGIDINRRSGRVVYAPHTYLWATNHYYFPSEIFVSYDVPTKTRVRTTDVRFRRVFRLSEIQFSKGLRQFYRLRRLVEIELAHPEFSRSIFHPTKRIVFRTLRNPNNRANQEIRLFVFDRKVVRCWVKVIWTVTYSRHEINIQFGSTGKIPL